MLVYENDDVTELAVRLVSFLNTHGLLKIHPEHQELLNRSLIYFIETKMMEIGVPVKSGGCIWPQSIPMPTIQKVSTLPGLGLEPATPAGDNPDPITPLFPSQQETNSLLQSSVTSYSSPPTQQQDETAASQQPPPQPQSSQPQSLPGTTTDMQHRYNPSPSPPPPAATNHIIQYNATNLNVF